MLQVEKDEKDPDISTIKAAHIRAMNFEPFAFRINGEALPELLDEYLFKHKDPGKGKRRSSTPTRTSQRSSTVSHWKRHSHSKMNTATRSLRKN